jgi:hypothetical protein
MLVTQVLSSVGRTFRAEALIWGINILDSPIVVSQDGDDGQDGDWPEWDHPDNHACTGVLAYVSGMPKRLRDRASVAVIQGWFDESGKEGWPIKGTSPVFLLAGYVAPVRVWAKFADAWQAELDQDPKLEALHTADAYTFSKQFGEHSLFSRRWGWRNETERDKRLLKLATIIKEHLKPIWNAYDVPDRLGITWMVSHDEYAAFKADMAKDPKATPLELKQIKHPYYLSFQYVLGTCLKYKNRTRTRDETVQIYFDCGMDNHRRLKLAFAEWLKVVELSDAHLLKQLLQREAEFRNDEKHPELQAADMLAYHQRKLVYELTQNKNPRYATSPIWTTIHSSQVEFLDLRYEAKQWKQLAGKVTNPFWPFWGTIRPKGRL